MSKNSLVKEKYFFYFVVLFLLKILIKIKEEIKDWVDKMKKSEEQLQKAENDASESDKKLLQAQKRIVLLESGEYGLTEAIKEIKGL